MTAPPSAPPSSPAVQPGAQKPTKVLPTDRVRVEKQFDLIRAYAAVSGPGNRVVTVADVANVAKLNASTVSLCNGFFVDTRLLERAPIGGFVPAPEVQQFQRAHAWNPDTAAYKLAPLLQQTWFFERLQPKLSMGAVGREEAVHDLADVANANKRYESQLYLLLDFLEITGLVRREGEMLRLGPAAGAGDHTSTVAGPPINPTATSAPEPGPSGAARASEIPTRAPTPVPGVHFSIDVSVTMAEIGSWDAPRIAAFFEGVAKVLAAKNGPTTTTGG